MLKKLTPLRIAMAFIVISTILNLTSCIFLPPAVSIHIDINGNTNGTMPKLIFVLFMTLLPLFLLYVQKVIKNIIDYRLVLTEGILFIVNLFILYINLQ